MKRTIFFILTFALCLSLCACGGGNNPPETTEAPTETNEPTIIATEEVEEATVEAEELNETQNVANTNYWVIDNVVDDFGDPTDEQIIKGLFTGTFSNTATSNSDLAVCVFFYPDEQVFLFRLLEYSDHRATYFDSDTIVFKAKIIGKNSESIEECTLTGIAPNGDLFMARDKNGDSYFGGNSMLNFLYYDYDVKCIVEIGSSKYAFTMYPDGFMDVFNEYKNN